VPRPRTARETLNALRWAPGNSLADTTLFVIDRTRPGEAHPQDGSTIRSLGRRTFETVSTTIPYYKIVRIESQGRVRFLRPERKPSTRKVR